MDGLLLIDKPAGMTSHDVVDVVRHVAKTRRVGHAGTLDPFATGLLILGINQATKALTGLVGLDKTYEATLELGATSDTFDIEGRITPSVIPTDESARSGGISLTGPDPSASSDSARDDRKEPTTEEIEQALDQFRGGYEQKAPLHSAKKIKGKKLYELARAGQATEEMRPSKRVSIYKLQATSYRFPQLELKVSCSSGTYIRSLADDIGRALGTGAYCSALRRTAIGSYNVGKAVSLAKLKLEGVQPHLIVNPGDSAER